MEFPVPAAVRVMSSAASVRVLALENTFGCHPVRAALLASEQ
ncbi:hypothetical protein ACFYPA_16580 [Streptomyces sp. NPDC005775]